MRRGLLAASFAAVILLALALRLPGLDVTPLHQDEGLNGWLTLRLLWWGRFEYLPTDNHGPLFYYLAALLSWLFGTSEVSLRLGPALAGSLLALSLVPVRRRFGSGGVLAAGALLAAAPGMVYFSRAAIHELLLVLASALLAASLARFALRPSRRWAAGCGAAAGACFATKETALISLGCLGAAALFAAVAWLASLPAPERAPRARALARAALANAPLALAVCALVIAVFFTSFFTRAEGLRDFFAAFAPWFEYGTSGRNQGKPFGYYWELLASTSGACRWLAAPAALLAAHRRDPLGLALAGWTAAAFLVYSWLPYKTPWCVLEIELPMLLLIGWAAGQALALALDAARAPAARALAALAFAAALSPLPWLLRESLDDLRERYDDPGRPYVYYHTQRSFYALLEDVLGAAAAAPGADGRGVCLVASESHDPALFYLYTRGWDPARVRQRDNPSPPRSWLEPAQIVISSKRHLHKVRRRLGELGAAWHEESYDTRPGFATTVLYRQELWDAYQAAGGRTGSRWPRPPVRDLPAPAEPEGD
jgi:uncharacterized protein (TIGR03663 family)